MYFADNEVNYQVINNDTPFGEVSDKYIPTTTKSIIEELPDNFEIVGYSQTHVRKHEKALARKHMVMLEDTEGSGSIHGGALRIVLFNSLDKSSGIRMYLGYYRDACANDCVFGDNIMEPIKIRHTLQNWKGKVQELVDNYDKSVESTTRLIDRLAMRKPSEITKRHIINTAATKIYTGGGEILDPTELNLLRRPEDRGDSFYHVYQRVQESLIRGGIKRISGPDNRISKTYGLRDQSNILKTNTELSDLIVEVAG